MEEIAFENGRISNFQGLMTLTLDRVILNTVVHHSSTSTYMPNFIEIEETFCGRTVEHLGPTLLGRLRRVDLTKLNAFTPVVTRSLVNQHVRTCTNTNTS